MVELIATLIIVGIIAVVAVPRMVDRSVFDSVGFRDATIGLLRYAQKSAVAQRRTVCVHFLPSQTWLTVRTAANDTACGVHPLPTDPPPAGETLMAGPTGPPPFLVTAASGTGYATTPSNFNFQASGAPSAGQSFTITGSTSVTVEAVTGHVH